ncbi:MAG: SufE family protein [Dysgonomonas sp.]|nr:SufE family protein [Dysgonomonas sp.]
MTLREKQSEFIELFNALGSWQERFQYLIDLGAELPELPEHQQCPSTQIMSCTSRTFFLATITFGKINIQGCSNASIPSGLIAIIREIFHGCKVEDLRQTAVDFHIKTDLINNLTEQRKAGLLEMINRILLL